ncbi:MAG TPA: aldolase/citrate lyase family protein [Terriglobales bacterium]|nr:aldolase/citrate lyase family protein [Terriglobales bacterium]
MATTANVNTTTFEAGRSGADIRSDCRVVFSGHSSGGIDIELQSKVAAYYGDSILTQARQVLADLGVEHGRLLIEDAGALPFVISARIEAAVRRAGLGEGRRSLPEQVPLPAPSPRDRLRRSRLYLPGSEPKYFVNAALHAPDTIILDLEDAVHSNEKDAARVLVRNALRAVDFGTCERMVRINQLPLGLADLDEVVPESPDLVLIPKTEHPEQVAEVEQRIARVQSRCGLHRDIWLLPILETAMGIENAMPIATASPRNVALTIGLEDYTADIGVAKTALGAESLYARTRIINAAKAAGLQANDSVYGDVGDLEGLAAWARNARALGFEGMGCVHPLQVAVIHQAFAPAQQEIDRALRIVAAYEDAQARGLGVVSLGSKMIDAPVVQRALKLVERARLMGLIHSPRGNTDER